ncbi:probable polygalacturonase At1g80170 [Macadamia integrifolia]|uniref:probable polygalacturonase At1g80170 n=1 Tax=Macadamia integrifolia TaxID=60698 RepID=UPI001C4F8CBD|nr:probable polygalacturonase At1g80170 [Macadamia integrifolia]
MRKPNASCSCNRFLFLIYLFLCSNLLHVEGFDSLIQLPRFRETRNRISSRGVVSVFDFGAKGDGIHNDAKAFKNAWEAACSYESQSTLEVPAGRTYLVGPIDFGGPCQSKVTLRVSGTIVAPEDPHVWDGLNRQRWLYFHGLNDLTVEGGGTINGMGQEWWSQSCKINITNPCRHAPTAISFHRCTNLKVRNIMTVNSQQMHIAFTNCQKVVASHIIVVAPVGSPNTDGIHISASTNVQVKDSVIGTGDDCISIVSNTSRVRVRNISCGPGHGISIGSLGKSKSCDDVNNVLVDGAFISNTENGVRIKTWQGGCGFARKIKFQNVLMENVSNPIIIDQYYCDSLIPCQNQTMAVQVDSVSFIGIEGTSATEEAIRFACSDNSPCRRIYLEDIQLFSHSGEPTTAFCWQAWGAYSGIMRPPSCFPCSGSFIKQKVISSAIHLAISR